MTNLALLVLFPALMAFAAVSDLLTMTIPNRVAILLCAGFLAMAFALGLPIEAIGSHALAGLFVLALTFALFAAGWIGGGDAKLSAATALWMGWDNLAEYAIHATLIGGALTLVIVQARRWPLPRMLQSQAWVVRLHGANNGVPYGIALAAAGLLIYPDTRLWLTGVV